MMRTWPAACCDLDVLSFALPPFGFEAFVLWVFTFWACERRTAQGFFIIKRLNINSFRE